MPDRALQKAYFLRDELARKIEDIESQKIPLKQQLGKVSAFISQWHEYAGTEDDTIDLIRPSVAEGNVDSADSKTPSVVALTEKAVLNPKKEAVADAALELIREAGTPIRRVELYDALVKRGIVVNGIEPLVTFSTMLWRMKSRVAHLKGFGYWDANLPYAPAAYGPHEKALDE